MAISNVQDIALENGDLQYKQGDLAMAVSDGVHIQHILLAGKGHYKHSAITGCSIFRMVNSPNTAGAVDAFLHTVKSQLEYDGFGQVKFVNDGGIENLKIDAIRER
jgi:hypothetical protein